ncbi:conserved hypothetical protein [Paraburkholderia sabiae]|nr:conserved hypothetical protein [Paraburkholderia sabiae]
MPGFAGGVRFLSGFLSATQSPVFAFLVFGFWLGWHPRFRIGLLVLPLCGAAPTFLCSGKEK